MNLLSFTGDIYNNCNAVYLSIVRNYTYYEALFIKNIYNFPIRDIFLKSVIIKNDFTLQSLRLKVDRFNKKAFLFTSTKRACLVEETITTNYIIDELSITN